MAAAANNKQSAQEFLKELRGSDRVFQIDRDTALVFTGLHVDDVRPFLRIGAGKEIPDALLKHIEHVILPEDDPCNMGLELAWLGATVASGEKKIRYVGSRDRINQVYSFAGMPEINEPEERPVQPVPYQAFRAQDIKRDHVTTVFMTNGDAVVQMGSTRIYDHHANRRIRLTLDKEYELMSRALQRREQILLSEENASLRGFYWPGAEYSPGPDRPQMLFVAGDSTTLINPSLDHHQALFEHAIDPARIDSCISYSASAPGFVEALRRKNSEKKPIHAFTVDQEAYGQLRRAYRESKMQFISDGGALPHARDVQFYVSRTASHVAFSWRVSAESDRPVQAIFPIGGKRQSRSFDYIKGPHDFEVRLLRSREELKELDAALTLLFADEKSEAQLERLRLSAGILPLLPATEYRIAASDTARGLAEHILRPFHGEDVEEQLRNLLFLHLGLEWTPESLDQGLRDLRTLCTPGDVRRSINLSQYLRFLTLLPGFANYSPKQRKLLQSLQDRIDPARHRASALLALRSAVRGHILVIPGKATFLNLEAITAPPVRLRCPPSLAAIEADRKAYPRMLRQWAKEINRAGDPPGYSLCLDLLEKLYESRLSHVEDRSRLSATLRGLGIGSALNAAPPPPANRGAADLSAWWGKLRGWFEGGGKIAAAIAVVALALIVLLGAFVAVRAISSYASGGGVSERGDSAEELRAAALVQPGALESGEPAPGEDQIEAPPAEVLQYANALAARNGFRPINQQGNNRRNPDLVFPGDRLRLPDGRIALVQRGQHLWEIAERFYRRDFARLKIIDRQLAARISDGGAIPPASVRDQQTMMRRLAVTEEMRRVLRSREQALRAPR